MESWVLALKAPALMGSLVTILIVVAVVFIVYKVVKVAIPLFIAAAIVAFAWWMGWLDPVLGVFT